MNVSDAIGKRRSYRFLQPVEITDEMVLRLAEAAQLAPSCFNNQPWRFVFVRSDAMRQKLAEALSRGNEWAKEASMHIVVFAKRDDDCMIKGRDYFLFDTGLATGQMMLQATEMGLVTHAMAGYSEAKVKDSLGIPESYQVITVIAVGQKADVPQMELSEQQLQSEHTRPERLPAESFVFYETFS